MAGQHEGEGAGPTHREGRDCICRAESLWQLRLLGTEVSAPSLRSGGGPGGHAEKQEWS